MFCIVLYFYPLLRLNFSVLLSSSSFTSFNPCTCMLLLFIYLFVSNNCYFFQYRPLPINPTDLRLPCVSIQLATLLSDSGHQVRLNEITRIYVLHVVALHFTHSLTSSLEAPSHAHLCTNLPFIHAALEWANWTGWVQKLNCANLELFWL